MNKLGIKNKHSLRDLAHYGTESRKDMHPDVLIGDHPTNVPFFREGDILDANATLNLIIKNNHPDYSRIDDFDARLTMYEQILRGNYDSLSNRIDYINKRDKGDPGLSAYEVAVEEGFEGTLEEWLDSLKGEVGEQGEDGERGITPLLRINPQTNMWEVSYDSGSQYSSLDVVATGPRGVQGPKGDSGESLEIYKQYESVQQMNADQANVPENKFVLISKQDTGDPDHGNIYIRTSTGYRFVAKMDGSVRVNGVGIASIEQTQSSDVNGGTNIWTATLTDGTTSQFVVKNGDAAQITEDLQNLLGKDVYTKQEVDEIVSNITGPITVVTGTMTVIDNGNLGNMNYLAYVSMDLPTSKKVAHISYLAEDANHHITFGNNLSYYEAALYGSYTLNNVWCTPIQSANPGTVKYTAFIQDDQGTNISNRIEYKHVFMQQAEYNALPEYDDDTIYFIWDGGDPEAFVLGGGLPIVLG